MKPTRDSRPPYQQAAEVIRQEILSGKLKPGDQLPSHRELQERFGIANMTARSALRVLRDDALIYTTQGVGSFVADPVSSSRSDQSAGASDGGAVAAEADPGAGEAAGSITDVLTAVREQLRAMNAEMQAVKREVADLQAKLNHLEQQGAR
ncbi:GntR family transcriptional regulator [Streptomyces sp. VNUA116]|uniref:GntR family transcriptional regulator n=1 Tax=Streptomyces sp. VNUA116 TaxID=3062449 RepID=UPI0026747513|nr:GntR family transcriptional regulator [Streptomyces sp. VNUA116]WKU45940.1 GntR family transcriptional regulator [Streptomyces sp. VNUA116]